MANVLTLTAAHVETLQGRDGGAFRDFVNEVIRGQAAMCHISPASIITDSRNARDGGVDCEVKQAASPDPSGRLGHKTCWQFKAWSHDKVTVKVLRDGARQPYASKLIGQGYAYRFCIADSVTAEKQSKWEKVLRDEIQKINPSAPDPQILTSASLASWASEFLGIVCRFISVRRFLDLDAWKKTATHITPTYVPVPGWSDISQQILKHADFSHEAQSLILPIHADAGVGKTRLVYEIVAAIPSARSLLLYTSDDEEAQNIAHDLARNQEQSALLIIDECSQEARLKVDDCLRGNEKRVRVITIANYARTSSGREPTLQQMPNDQVEKVLEANFPDVSPERRRAAVSLAGGFVKIAADICKHDIAGGLMSAEDYYRFRVPGTAARKVIEAISLVKKVGFSSEVSGQFDELCKLTGLKVDDAKRRARELKDIPGFVAIAGRYFYITPEAIARIALQSAWTHWIQDDPPGFFTRVPESLLETFQARVAQSGNEQFRAAVAAHFNNWSAKLSAADLDDKKKVDRLIALIETDPTRFLPVLVRLIEQATPEQLLGNRGSWMSGWGPRRSLVWMCDRLCAFPEYFYDVEKILFRLALYESETGITNNATGIWKGLFMMRLSGTSVPYVERLRLLREKLKLKPEAGASLALDALAGIFEMHFSRMVGPAVIAGRVPPPDWQPTTYQEYRECFSAAFALYEIVLSGDDLILRQAALEEIAKHVAWFLRIGFADDVRKLFRPPRIPITSLPKVLEEIDIFYRFEKDSKKRLPKDYLAKINDWKESLTPSGFGEQLRAVVGRPSFHFFRSESDDLKAELTRFADQFVANRSLLRQEIGWLTSAQANGAGELGSEIGKRDADANLFDDVVVKTPAENLSVCRGYLIGLIQNHPEHIHSVSAFLDKLEAENPTLAFDYALTIPVPSEAFGRWLRLCDSGKIPAHYVEGLIYRFQGELNVDLLKKALPRLLAALPTQARSGSAALNLIHQWLDQNTRAKTAIDLHDDVWCLVSQVLARVVPNEAMEGYYWTEIMKLYSRVCPKEAVKIACGVLDEDLTVQETAQELLILLAKEQPEVVMNALGDVLLKEQNAWKLEIRGFGGLLMSLPQDIILSWLDKAQVEGARKIASNLPRPYVNADGKAIVPTLTEQVLERFGNDEKVARQFVCGSGIRSYSGDIAGQRLQEAAVASKFLQHRIPAVREWARIEKQMSEHEAARWQQEDAERFI